MNFHTNNIFYTLLLRCCRISIVHRILMIMCYILLFTCCTLLSVGCSQTGLQNDSQDDPDEFILTPPDLSFTSFAGDKFETITIGFSRILQGIFPADGYTPEEPIYISLEIPSMMIKSDEYYETTEYQKHKFSINEIYDNHPSIIVNGIYDISNITNFNINVNNVFKVWEAYPELTEKEKEDTLSESTNGISFTTINGYNGVLNFSGLNGGLVFCEATIELKDNLVVCITLALPTEDTGIITYILQSVSLK